MITGSKRHHTIAVIDRSGFRKVVGQQKIRWKGLLWERPLSYMLDIQPIYQGLLLLTRINVINILIRAWIGYYTHVILVCIYSSIA